MNSLRLAVVVGVVLLASTSSFVVAQWQSFEGPETPQINDIEAHGGYLFAATGEGIFRSQDDGSSWVSVNSGLPMDTFFRDLAVLDTDVFALTTAGKRAWMQEKGARILRATVGGENWLEVSAGLPDQLHSLTVIGDRLFVIGTDRGEGYFVGVYRSTDRGETWESVGKDTLDTVTPSMLAHNGRSLFTVGCFEGIYRSTDYGESWMQVAEDQDFEDSWRSETFGPPAWIEITSLVAGGGELFAAGTANPETDEIGEKPLGCSGHRCLGYTVFEVLFQSSDHGETWLLTNWERSPDDDELHKFFLDVVATPDSVFALTWDGVFRSARESEHWKAANSGLPAENGEQAIPLVSTVAAMGGRLFVGTWDGVYVSDDEGDCWSAANTGLPERTNVESLAVADEILYASLGAHGVYRSRDSGRTWSCVGIGSEMIRVDKIRSVLGGLFANTPQGLFRSRDSGESWEPIKPMPGFEFGAVAAVGSDLLVATEHSVYRSTDGGANWIDIDAPTQWATEPLLVSGEDLFLTAYEQGLYRSGDGGETWEKVADNHWDFSYLARVGESLFASNAHAGISRCDDNGHTWTVANSGLPSPPFRRKSQWATPVLKAAGDRLFVSTEEAGVFMLNKDKTRWMPVNVGLPADTFVWLDASNGDLFARSDDGRIWRFRISQVEGATGGD